MNRAGRANLTWSGKRAGVTMAKKTGKRDPFAAKGEFRPGALSTLASSLKQQRKFKIRIEGSRR
jgi:hypothetical protein